MEDDVPDGVLFSAMSKISCWSWRATRSLIIWRTVCLSLFAISRADYRYRKADEDFSTDMPTLLEAKLVCNTIGMLINPKPEQKPEIVNATIQLIFNTMIPPGQNVLLRIRKVLL